MIAALIFFTVVSILAAVYDFAEVRPEEKECLEYFKKNGVVDFRNF